MSGSENHDNKQRVDALIDHNLRLIYEDMIEEALPDRFKDLLAVLKAQDTKTDRDQ